MKVSKTLRVATYHLLAAQRSLMKGKILYRMIKKKSLCT